MEWLRSYGPQIIGVAILLGSIAFFVCRFMLVRVFKSIDLLFLKYDGLAKQIRRLELLAASQTDNTAIVGKIMGNGD